MFLSLSLYLSLQLSLYIPLDLSFYISFIFQSIYFFLSFNLYFSSIHCISFYLYFLFSSSSTSLTLALSLPFSSFLDLSKFISLYIIFYLSIQICLPPSGQQCWWHPGTWQHWSTCSQSCPRTWPRWSQWSWWHRPCWGRGRRACTSQPWVQIQGEPTIKESSLLRQ